MLKYVPHRHWVFSIPKRFRVYFMFDRKLLTKLSRYAWKVFNLYLRQVVPDDDAKPGAAIAILSFCDFQNFHPHAHVLITDGCFSGEGAFRVNPKLNPKDLEVFKMLKGKGNINAVVIEIMMNWRHRGFKK